MHRLWVGLLVTSSILFSGCSQQGEPIRQEQRLTTTVQVAANLPAATGGAVLQPQGVPSSNLLGELRVLDGPSEVFFNAQGTPDPAGSRLTLTGAQPSRQITLPVGRTFSFRLMVKDLAATANEVAYAEQNNLTFTGAGPNQVTLQPRTYISRVDLTPSIPDYRLGDFITFNLNVSPVAHPEWNVPEGDYEVAYSVTGGEIVRDGAGAPIQSRLGVLVRPLDNAQDQVSVTATVSGLKPDRTLGTLTKTMAVPRRSAVGVSSDLTLPTVTLDAVGGYSIGVSRTLTGTVSDNAAINRVEVYDSVRKLGNATLASGGLSSAWSIPWTPTTSKTSITVLAFDASGNVGRVTRTMPFHDLFEDFEGVPKLQWSNPEWTYQSTYRYAGVQAMRSAVIPENATSENKTTVHLATAGKLSFYYLVGSESCCDYLRLFIDGTQRLSVSGTGTWTFVEYDLAQGTHEIKFVYSKDGSVSNSFDGGVIDNLTITNVH